jgi:heme A synthase
MIRHVSSLARFCRIVLGYNLAVILWGAYVRASGSGAGCGGHWPLCNGTVMPRGRSATEWIEYSHRVSSGLVLVLAVVLVVWACRAAPRGHEVRRAAVLALVFTLSEAALGAGLVLFRLVAHDESLARALVTGGHLLNTLLLLGALTMALRAAGGISSRAGAAAVSGASSTVALANGLGASTGVGAGAAAVSGAPSAAAARGRGAGPRGGGRQPRRLGWQMALGLAAIMALAATGAVAALGDTLFPAGSLSQGLAADLSPASHLLVRLRTLHPLLAVAAGIYLFFLCDLVATAAPAARRDARRVRLLVLAQGAIGVVNIGLLAPIWLQLTHLLVADLLWIALVLMALACRLPQPAALPVLTARADLVEILRSGGPDPTFFSDIADLDGGLEELEARWRDEVYRPSGP